MTVYRQYGVDSGGWRPVRMSPVFNAAWEQVVAVLGFRPVITQGGHMGDLAAKASGPTHDGDALDLRVRNLTGAQVEQAVKVLRAHGIAAWLRNVQHGGFKDPHIHAVPGPWAHPSPSALRQWHNLRDGRNGLASNGPDYHPYPLATTPPKDWFDMATEKELRAIIRDELAPIEKRLVNQFAKERARDKAERLRDKRRFQKLRDFAKGNAAMLAAIDEAITELDEEN